MAQKDEAKKDPKENLLALIDKELKDSEDPKVREFAKKLKERVSKFQMHVMD